MVLEPQIKSSNLSESSGQNLSDKKMDIHDLIGEVLPKGQVRSTHFRRSCLIRCMNVDKARGVRKDRGRWRSVVSAYPFP